MEITIITVNERHCGLIPEFMLGNTTYHRMASCNSLSSRCMETIASSSDDMSQFIPTPVETHCCIIENKLNVGMSKSGEINNATFEDSFPGE